MFWEKPMCYSVFEKTFSYLSWLSLLLILESWVLNLDLDSWKLELWSVLDSILNSFFDYHELTFELFVITFFIIKTSLNQSWFIIKLCFYTTNVYSRKMYENPKDDGQHILKIRVRELFTHGEGISTPRARHTKWQPLIECARHDFKIMYFPFFLFFLSFWLFMFFTFL